jgi:hypothetical protein
MSVVRLPRPAALASVLVLLVVAIVAFPRKTYGQVGGRVLNPNGVTPTASRVLVTIKGPDGESTRPVVAGRFTFPTVANGTRVTVQAMAQGLLSAPIMATAPDTMVVLILRPAGAQKFNIVPQGAQARTQPAPQPPAQPATPSSAGATAAASEQAAAPPAAAPEAPPQKVVTPQVAAPQAATPQPATPQAATPQAATPQAATQQGPTQQGSAQGLSVADALFTTAELVNREPASVSGCTAAACATRYAADVGTITFWTRLTGGAPGRWVEHVWFWDGTEMARVRQKVEGPTWRTWTRKTIMPEWTGDWRVEVRAEDGTVLAERFFTIEGTP